MRRRALMLLMWLAGTFFATGVVFITVDRMGDSLFELGNTGRTGANAGFSNESTTTTTAAVEPTATDAPTTTEAPTTTTTEAPTTVPETDAPPVTDEPEEPAGPGPTTRPATTAPRQPTSNTTSAPITSPPVVTTSPPVIDTTEPPTTQAPPPTTSSSSCGQPKAQAVGRNGNVFYYRICSDGLRYSVANAAPGWSVSANLKGPPSVSVTFSNGAASVSCTLEYDAFDNLVLATGDC